MCVCVSVCVCVCVCVLFKIPETSLISSMGDYVQTKKTKTCIEMYIRTHMLTYVLKYMHTYIYTYIHTYMHMICTRYLKIDATYLLDTEILLTQETQKKFGG